MVKMLVIVAGLVLAATLACTETPQERRSNFNEWVAEQSEAECPDGHKLNVSNASYDKPYSAEFRCDAPTPTPLPPTPTPVPLPPEYLPSYSTPTEKFGVARCAEYFIKDDDISLCEQMMGDKRKPVNVQPLRWPRIVPNAMDVGRLDCEALSTDELRRKQWEIYGQSEASSLAFLRTAEAYNPQEYRNIAVHSLRAYRTALDLLEACGYEPNPSP